MKLWMGGELAKEEADHYRTTRKLIETSFNGDLGTSDYGPGVAKWAYIAIIGGPDDYREIAQYNKKDQCLEIRLRVPLNDFLSASETERVGLICSSLAKSIERMRSIAPSGFKHEDLKRDFDRFVRQHEW